MGVEYQLVNVDKKEILSFTKINTGGKVSELSGTAIAGSMITYYMLKNIGDKITFVDDHNSNFKLFGKQYSWDDFNTYKDVTDEVVDNLIQEGIAREDGKIWIDEEENLYYCDLTNIFDPKFEWNK